MVEAIGPLAPVEQLQPFEPVPPGGFDGAVRAGPLAPVGWGASGVDGAAARRALIPRRALPLGGRAIGQGRDQGGGHRVGAAADVDKSQGVGGVAAQLLQGRAHGFRPPFEHQAIGLGARQQVRQAGRPLAVIGRPNRPAAPVCPKRYPNEPGPLGGVH